MHDCELFARYDVESSGERVLGPSVLFDRLGRWVKRKYRWEPIGQVVMYLGFLSRRRRTMVWRFAGENSRSQDRLERAGLSFTALVTV